MEAKRLTGNPTDPIETATQNSVAQEAPPRKKTKIQADPDSSDDEIPEYMINTSNNGSNAILKSHYLDTINRQVLDFDSEKVCLVTLSNANVYCCLVCGKYFQGKSSNSPAYLHSIDQGHYVYLNLSTEKCYILPENYEIGTESISDILQVLNPKYSIKDIEPVSYDLRRSEYRVGYVGLDNISKNDYSNVVLQLLSHIEPIRDFYINLTQKPKLTDVLTRRAPLNTKLALLVRKLWSKYLFRNHVSPHEFLQYVSLITKNTFPITEQRSPKKFLVWLLNSLNHELVKSTKIGVLSQTLQGNIEVTKTTIATEQVQSQVRFVEQKDTKVAENHKFWIIQLDLPPHSVFDETKIQEVELEALLMKYNGHRTTMVSSSQSATYNLIAPLPPYILIHIDRKLEDGQTRGNPTVVKFPSKIDFGKYTKDATTELNYELVANIRHELTTGLEIDHKDDKQNWSIDLKKDDISWVTLNNSELGSCERELLFLNENYIQLWKRCA